MMRETKALSVIRTDGGTQARAGLDEAKVAEYAERMMAGDDFPALVAFYDGSDYWLADGFHRHAAAILAGKNTYLVDVKQGTRRDAVLYAVGANAEHGLPRTDGDKRRAVETLLRDEEWVKWSDREIAKRCKVSHPFVAKIRAEIVTGNVTSEGQERTYTTRHGTTATMATGNIGRVGDPGPLKRAIEANVNAAAYESIHSLQNAVLAYYKPYPERDVISILENLKADRRDPSWSGLSLHLGRNGKIFRENDLRQAVNNALDSLRFMASQTAISEPSNLDQESPTLLGMVEGFILAYKDPFHRDTLQIPNPSHTNGTFWQAIRDAFKRDGVSYKNEAELKIAIKRAFARLKNEPEPDLAYWTKFLPKDEEQPTSDPTPTPQEPTCASCGGKVHGSGFDTDAGRVCYSCRFPAPVLNSEQEPEPTPDFVEDYAPETPLGVEWLEIASSVETLSPASAKILKEALVLTAEYEARMAKTTAIIAEREPHADAARIVQMLVDLLPI